MLKKEGVDAMKHQNHDNKQAKVEDLRILKRYITLYSSEQILRLPEEILQFQDNLSSSTYSFQICRLAPWRENNLHYNYCSPVLWTAFLISKVVLWEKAIQYATDAHNELSHENNDQPESTYTLACIQCAYAGREDDPVKINKYQNMAHTNFCQAYNIFSTSNQLEEASKVANSGYNYYHSDS